MQTPTPRRRILTQFLLGIALPTLLLGYLAFRGIRNDQALVEREQRDELAGVVSVLHTAIEQRLDTLEAELNAVVQGGAPAEVAGGRGVRSALEVLLRDQPAVDAVFRVRRAGDVDLVALAYVPSTPTTVDAGASGGGAQVMAGWEEARRLELRESRPAAALPVYEKLLDQARGGPPNAEILAAIARVQRKVGRHGDAVETYRRLAREHGGERTPGGLPYAVAARLEGGAAQLSAEGWEAGLPTLADLHRDLLAGVAPVDRVQLGFMAVRVRATMAEALESMPAAPALAWRDSIEQMERREAAALTRMARLDALGDHLAAALGGAAAPAGGADGSAGDGAGGWGVRRRVVMQGGGHVFPVLLGPALGPQGERAQWGMLLDAAVLREQTVLPALERATTGAGIDWVLHPSAAEAPLASSAAPAGDPLLSASLPPPLATWRLELYRSEPGLARALLTSRRGIYFYAFLLLAGLLTFGLALTMRSVNQELRLARMQSDFVSTVSHEFKSPLTAIRQLTEMLREDRVPSEARRRRYYDVLLEQSERLSMLIDNVLDFARMEEGRRELDRTLVQPGELVEEAAAAAGQRFAHVGFRIRQVVEPGLPAVRADRGALAQALSNLLDNAVKYSGQAREVVVGAAREEDTVVLSVRDDGIGLTAQDAARVFDRFYRAGDPLTRQVGGTGLGLTLVRQIAEAHGGRAEVVSRPGGGSTFTIRLPAVAGDTAANAERLGSAPKTEEAAWSAS